VRADTPSLLRLVCPARAKPTAGRGRPGEQQQQQQQQQEQEQHRKRDPPRLARDWLPLPGARRGRACAVRPNATGSGEVPAYLRSSHLCTRPRAATGGNIGGERSRDVVETTVLHCGDHVFLGRILFVLTSRSSSNRSNSSSSFLILSFEEGK